MGTKVIWILFCAFVIDNSSGVPKNKFHYNIQIPDVVTHHQFVYNDEPKQFDDGYQQSWKTLRTEKYETETIDNPHSDNPDNKYLIKGSLQVREKLPFGDTTIGYDKQYQYPLSDLDYQYHKSEKTVDFENAKNDPFPSADISAKTASFVLSEKKKQPKQLSYHYQYPNNDNDFQKNYQTVNTYIDGNNTPKKKQKVKQAASKNKPKQYYSYQYPSNDYEFHNNVKYVDSYLGKSKKPVTTPLFEETPTKKPKQHHYSYQYPSGEYDFHKNVHIVDSYLSKPDLETSEKLKEYDYDDHSKQGYNFDNLGPSSNYEYERYKTDGPSYDYLADYSNVEETKVPLEKI